MANQPDDGYERYFREKLWELIPDLHRMEDGTAERPGVLRAFVEIFAAQAAVLRRSQDRLWDDSFIDLCDEWAVPYLGDLVGARLVSALNPRGRRVDVAKTVYYRRRKGTPRLLEELIGDIADWDGKLTESFRGLARCRHGLDPAPPPLGRWSRTPRGGWADLRDARVAALAGGPFDEYAHLGDVRRQRGADGLWNIPRVVFHLYRLVSYELHGVAPRARAGGVTFTFDPSGRDAPLFGPRRVLDDWDEWTSPEPWELPAPISCRLLAHAEYRVTEALVADLENHGLPAAAAADMRRIADVLFRGERPLRDRLAAMATAAMLLAAPTYGAILDGAITADSGKRHLLHGDEPALQIALAPPAPPVPASRTAAGNLSSWGATAPGKDVVVDPDRGRFAVLGAAPATGAPRVSYRYGFPGQIGAGAYDRTRSLEPPPFTVVPRAAPGAASIAFGAPPLDGVWQVADSATYGPIADAPAVKRLVLQADDLTRPYVRLAADWILTAAPGGDAELVLEGLWLGADGAFSVVLRGEWARVTLRHCTLDPGGVDVDGAAIHPVRVAVEGSIDELVIDRSIAAAVAVRGAGLIDRLIAADSIFDAAVARTAAIASSPGETRLARVTVLGGLDVERLDASDSLITGAVDVTDVQHGCFRFSAAPAGSRLPHPYRSFVLAGGSLFTTATFGQPGYAQLADQAPAEVARGAENGGAMGAWNGLLDPIKLDSLRRKIEEYLPFGCVPCLVCRT